MEPLSHLIYASSATVPFADETLVTLLSGARSNNANLDVTGMLLYDDGSFFQVLEGTMETLERVFEIIRQDPRHTNVTVIIKESIPRRAFDAWTMGFAHVDQSELGSIEGLNDFFRDGDSFTALSQGRAKKLLKAFG